MVDDRELIRHARRRAPLASGPQPPHPQRPGGRLVRPAYPISCSSSSSIVPHRCGSSFSRISQSAAYSANASGPAGFARRACAHRSDTPDRLPVPAQVTGDRRDRPALIPENVSFQILSLCDHRRQGSSVVAEHNEPRHQGSPPRSRGSRPGVSSQEWGSSKSRSGENQVSVVTACSAAARRWPRSPRSCGTPPARPRSTPRSTCCAAAAGPALAGRS